MPSFSKTSLLLCINTVTTATAFLIPPRPSQTKLHFYLPEDGVYGGGYQFPVGYPMDSQYGPPPLEPGFDMMYDHAVECANNPGLCDIDELMGLARELEEFQECYVDMGPEACEDEIAGRHMLADALYAQREMEIQDMEMGRMPFGQGQMMYNQFANNNQGMSNNGYADNDQRMHNDSRYQNRAMPTNGKDKGSEHDRSGFIDI